MSLLITQVFLGPVCVSLSTLVSPLSLLLAGDGQLNKLMDMKKFVELCSSYARYKDVGEAFAQTAISCDGHF